MAREPSATGARTPVVRDVHRAEFPAYLELVVSNAGQFERDVGLMDRVDREFRGFTHGRLGWLLGLLRAIGRSPVRMLVADDGGTLVGTTLAVLLGPWAYVAAVGVRPDHRRQGVAESLVRRAEELGRRARKERSVLEVDAANEPALRLYAKLGWAGCGSVRWWRDPPPASTSSGTRSAALSDRRLAHEASSRALGFEFGRGFVHPCELSVRGIGDRTVTVTAGPASRPSIVVRTSSGLPGETGFVLPVVVGPATQTEVRDALDAAEAELTARRASQVVVATLDGAAALEDELRRRGAVLRATSQFWTRPLARA